MIQLHVIDDTESRLRDQAERRGLTAERYAMMILELMTRTDPDRADARPPLFLTATDEEWEREVDDLADARDDPAPPIPAEATRREAMYEDRT